MLDEQIIEEAKNYSTFIGSQGKSSFGELYDAFIAGAHSRDEETKELKEEIESLQEQYNTCFDGFKKRGTKLGELMKENVKLRNDNKDLEQALACAEDVVDTQCKELDKLRNPWISVEERLPRDEDYDDENIYCFLVRQECGFIYNCTFDGEEWLTAAPDGEEWGVGCVTHWMPITKAPKL